MKKLQNAAAYLKAAPDEIDRKVLEVMEQAQAVEKELAKARREAAKRDIEVLLNDVAKCHGVPVLAAKVNALDSEMLREMSDWVRAKLGSGVVALGAVLRRQAESAGRGDARPGRTRPRCGQDRAAGGARSHRRRRRRPTDPRAGGRQGCQSPRRCAGGGEGDCGGDGTLRVGGAKMLAIPQLLKSVKYVVDTKGRPSAAVLGIEEWKRLLEWLDDEEDLQVAREALAELAAVGNDANKAGWLKWEDVRDELDE